LAGRRRPRAAYRGARDVGRAGQAGHEGRRVNGVRGGGVGVGGGRPHRRARGPRRRSAPMERLERPAIVKAGQVLPPRAELNFRLQETRPAWPWLAAQAAPHSQQPEAHELRSQSSTDRDDLAGGSILPSVDRQELIAVSKRPALHTVVPPQGRRAACLVGAAQDLRGAHGAGLVAAGGRRR